jgi:hypothetical protein
MYRRGGGVFTRVKRSGLAVCPDRAGCAQQPSFGMPPHGVRIDDKTRRAGGGAVTKHKDRWGERRQSSSDTGNTRFHCILRDPGGGGGGGSWWNRCDVRFDDGSASDDYGGRCCGVVLLLLLIHPHRWRHGMMG